MKEAISFKFFREEVGTFYIALALVGGVAGEKLQTYVISGG